MRFDDMVEKAMDAIKQKYIPFQQTTTSQAEPEFLYLIDTIEFGYMQIASQDESDEYLLVPVWDFWGVESYDDEALLRTHHSYLTVNAIDGSIIDRTIGY